VIASIIGPSLFLNTSKLLGYLGSACFAGKGTESLEGAHIRVPRPPLGQEGLVSLMFAPPKDSAPFPAKQVDPTFHWTRPHLREFRRIKKEKEVEKVFIHKCAPDRAEYEEPHRRLSPMRRMNCHRRVAIIIV
jgi:hypothetical protein